MTKLKIQNVGPIKNVEFELKRFNFFIGRQSSGKSTIAKIISYCMWLEKEVLTHPDNQDKLSYYENDFLWELENFHSMHNFFLNHPNIYYESEYITISYSEGKCSINLKRKNKYKRHKVLYVPAERSMAIRDVILTKENYLRSFSIDFNTARNFFSTKQRLDLLHLGIQYYTEYKDGETVNKIKAKDNSYEIKLDDASSGLQSIVPAVVTIAFFSKMFYKDDNETRTLNVKQDSDRKHIRNYIRDYFNISDTDKDQMIDRLLSTHKTCFVLEEPEQNLYPLTQREFLNFIVSCCNGQRKHNLSVTTHSPYIINQLNLLIKAHDKNIKIDGASIPFNDLNVYAVQDGTIRDLKVKNEGIHLIDTERLSEDINNIYETYSQL